MSKKTKKTSKKTAEKETTEKTAKKTTKVEGKGKDQFGSRLGSNNARINACLTKNPKTMAQLCKEAGITGTVYTHLGKMIEKVVVEKTEKGYKLL